MLSIRRRTVALNRLRLERTNDGQLVRRALCRPPEYKLLRKGKSIRCHTWCHLEEKNGRKQTITDGCQQRICDLLP
jgi:hypothetical protein